MTDLQPTPTRAGAVRAVKPRAARARTPKMLVPAISAFAVAGMALVAVAQSAAPMSEAASVPSVDEIAQAQAQGYSASLVTGEEGAADVAVADDRGADAAQVTVATPEPEPEPAPTEEATSTDAGSTGGSSESTSSAPSYDYSAGSLQELAANILASQGFGSADYNCFAYIVEKESSWNHLAVNNSSGAYGLMQALPGSKMSTHGSDWQTNPETQIRWGLDYMVERYGSPCGAYNFWLSNSWY